MKHWKQQAVKKRMKGICIEVKQQKERKQQTLQNIKRGKHHKKGNTRN